uniref:Putative cytochrome c oxidase subunit viia n=1 Tax=Xenopsylla cheopis TaxID=163159 RepID=A0A6M2DGY7_XENCH
MNSVRRVAQLVQQNSRQISQTAVKTKGEVHPGYKTIKPIQEKFQIDNGVPVHLKGGPFDKVLYQITMGLCVVATCISAKMIYELAFPKKQ